MLAGITDWSLRNKFFVIVLTVLLVALGAASALRLPIDAVPDVTNVQVQVLTTAPALAPLEVERFITFPVEAAMAGLPDLEEVRSVSKFGLSAVTVVFEEGTDIYRARQLVQERLPEVREAIPEGYGDPEMGPISTGLGEIYQFEVRGDGVSPMELRSLLDWYVAYQLKSVPGVVEINTFGGEVKTYEVQPRPDALAAHAVSIPRIFEAIEKNNRNVGGAYLVRHREQTIIRGAGLIENIDDIGRIVVGLGDDQTPIYLANVADVAFAPMVRQGVVTRDGRGEAVVGIVMMLMGENSRDVSARVDAKIQEIRKTLPAGVTIETFYDRTDLVKRTIHTVRTNLLEGGLLVIAVLLLMLGSLRGGLIVAVAIPLSMLFAFMGMVYAGVSGNLMSLGAIDFGLIVDGSVVLVENVFRSMSGRKSSGVSSEHVVKEASREVARPIGFAVGIILIVYLPILTLRGIEGKMFRPMALTVVFALAGSLVVALTVVPVLCALFLQRPPKRHETHLVHWIRLAYEPALAFSVSHKALTVGLAAALFLLSALIAPFLGGEFVPRLDEGAIALQVWRLPSVSVEEAAMQSTTLERVLRDRFPEIETIVTKTGRPEIATDPMGVEISDIIVMLKPRSRWRQADKAELIEQMAEVIGKTIPGIAVSFSQPIELRVSELISGVRSDVAIKLFGDDLDILRTTAEAIARTARGVAGAADVKVEQTSGLPVLTAKVDREAIARYGINADEVLATIEALGGRQSGLVLEGQRRFPIQVRFPLAVRNDVEAIKALPVAAASGQPVPLGQLAFIDIEPAPAQISRERIQRRISVELNVRGRDIASFVGDAQKAIDSKVRIPAGYWIEWGGQFKNLEEATARLSVVVPLALLLIFVLLYGTFGQARPALLIFLNVPFAATGGVFSLALRGMPFSISAGVGFIALFGVAVMNGVVLLSYVKKIEQEESLSPTEAAMRGAMVRMRPVLMTALVAALGFVPMALSTGAGAEVQRPLATVVIGGLITSTLLTLFVLPTIYGWFAPPRAEVEL